MALLYLSLGSNIGDRRSLLEAAVSLLSARLGRVTAVSEMFETEPWGFKSDNSFMNMAVCIETVLDPFECLSQTQLIEHELGRSEKTVNGVYHDRCIDIDLLDYDGIVLRTDSLTLPHPLMHLRSFVLEPLCSIAPALVHPVLGFSISELLVKLNDNG